MDTGLAFLGLGLVSASSASPAAACLPFFAGAVFFFAGDFASASSPSAPSSASGFFAVSGTSAGSTVTD